MVPMTIRPTVADHPVMRATIAVDIADLELHAMTDHPDVIP